MNDKTALWRANEMATKMDDSNDPAQLDKAQLIWGAIANELHPQYRTLGFHEFYGAPIYEGNPTLRFEHMTDERVYARVEFILSEFKELLRGGLGIEMHTEFTTHDENGRKEESDLLGAICISPFRNLIGVVDALGDLNVVVNGFAIELGVDMNAVDQEIAASNFTKAGEDGNPIVNHYVMGEMEGEKFRDGYLLDPNQPIGKILKGPNFMEPQLKVVLGFDCEDEGCPHFGTAHGHMESGS